MGARARRASVSAPSAPRRARRCHAPHFFLIAWLTLRAAALSRNLPHGKPNRPPPPPHTLTPRRSRDENGQFERLQRLGKEALEAFGCTVLKSPHEGEALSSALCRAGFADAVLTDDGDAVMFGAPYILKDVEYGADGVKKLTCFDAGRLRAALGLAPSAPLVEAAAAFAALSGCDYIPKGVEGVGASKAWLIVRAAFVQASSAAGAGVLTDEGCAERVASKLAAPPSSAEEELGNMRQCTGSLTCGHDGGKESTRQRHLGDGCTRCGTTVGCTPVGQQAAPVGSAGGGPFGMVERGGGSSPCGCNFHARADDRATAAAHRCARETTGVAAVFAACCATFARPSAEASGAAKRDVARLAQANSAALDAASRRRLTWPNRPDVARLAAIFARVSPTQRVVVSDKVLAAAAQWDVRHPGAWRGAAVPFRAQKSSY